MTSLPTAQWVNFPLRPCRLVKLKQFYYAIGNSPARNIFYRDVSKALVNVNPVEPNSWRYQSFDPVFEDAIAKESKEEKPLRVLCLASGDLRNVLFSLGSDDLGTIDLVINDYDIHVLARNILILDMIFDETLQERDGGFDQAIFSIWFSTGLKESHFRLLGQRLELLVQQGMSANDGENSRSTSWIWHCYEPGLLLELCSVWQKWLKFFDADDEAQARGAWKTTQDMRHKTFLGIKHKGIDNDAFLDETEPPSERLFRKIKEHFLQPNLDLWGMSLDSEVFSNEKKEAWREEIQKHLLTGVFIPECPEPPPKFWWVNPTLFWRNDSYDLHYGTNSFSAFPFCLHSNQTRAVDACFEVFKGWLKNARSSQYRLSWTFTCLDSQVFCLNFDSKNVSWSRQSPPIMTQSNIELTFPSAYSNRRLHKGMLVYITGLLKRPGLNGSLGVVTKKDNEAGRWGVLFIKKSKENGSRPEAEINLPAKPLSLKQMNLIPLSSNNGSKADTETAVGCFDVVTTSNVADHIGLSTLLLVVRPLLIPGGTLLTTSFLRLDDHVSTKKYMKDSLLGTEPQWWTTLFGFRVMGYESNEVASAACKTSHSDFEPFLGVTRSTMSVVVWLATDQTPNLQLDSQGPIVKKLILEDHSAIGIHSKTHNLEAKVLTVLKRNGSALQSIWKETGYNHDRSTLIELLSGDLDTTGTGDRRSNDIILCGLEVPDRNLVSYFCSVLTHTPTICAMIGRHGVNGLWYERLSATNNDTTRFFFWCHQEIIQKANWTIDLYCAELGPVVCLSNVRVQKWGFDLEKLNLMRALVSDGSTSFPFLTRDQKQEETDSSPKRLVKEATTIPDLLILRLFNETEAAFMVRVEIRCDDLFEHSAISGKSFQIHRPGHNAKANASSVLDIEVTISSKMPSGSNRDVILSTTLVFSSPVASCGWKFHLQDGLLSIPKQNHHFFSTVRRTSIPGCLGQIRGGAKGGGYSGCSMSSFNTFAAAQFTSKERIWRQRKDTSSASFQMPLLTEVKDSLMTLLHVMEKLIYLEIKEDGIGIVAIVIRHGLVIDCQIGVPVLDMSICFLRADLSPAMAMAVSHLALPGGRIRSLRMWNKEYQLFQNICNYSRACASPALRGEHPKLRKCVASQELRNHFRRVLLRPLFPSATETENVINDIKSKIQNRNGDFLV